MTWLPIDSMPRGSVALTKIDDANGVRNEQRLKRGTNGNLFWTPDGAMYVYYTPTHYWSVR